MEIPFEILFAQELDCVRRKAMKSTVFKYCDEVHPPTKSRFIFIPTKRISVNQITETKMLALFLFALIC